MKKYMVLCMRQVHLTFQNCVNFLYFGLSFSKCVVFLANVKSCLSCFLRNHTKLLYVQGEFNFKQCGFFLKELFLIFIQTTNHILNEKFPKK